jgi:DNA processing protein
VSTPPEDLKYWLALARTPGVGAVTFLKLSEQFGNPTALFSMPLERFKPLNLAADTLASLADPDWAAVDQDLEWLSGSPQRRVLTLADSDYPPRLREIADPPPVMFVLGDVAALRQPQIAIVGSRNSTPVGAELAQDFARHLALRGITIISGLALGIDAASHRGALAGQGHTIAVMGTGLDRVYPPRHQELAEQIVASGALVSEFPLHTPVRPENFPRRNRIISGLALGVLVVEAAKASGSLITARHAIEQGREVFAIPGSIHNPLARGCHALIRDGAKLVETVDDILEELPSLPVLAGSDAQAPTAASQSATHNEEHTRLLDALGYDPVSVDVLVARTGLTANAVSSMLLLMELEGRVSSQAGGLYLRRNA